MVESFFNLLKRERIRRRKYKTREEARRKLLRAVQDSVLLGVQSNQRLLASLLQLYQREERIVPHAQVSKRSA